MLFGSEEDLVRKKVNGKINMEAEYIAAIVKLQVRFSLVRMLKEATE